MALIYSTYKVVSNVVNLQRNS